MPRPSLESLPDRPLAIGASGDVVAARKFARDLVACCDRPPSDRTLAVLILAAACLYVDAHTPVDPGLRDVVTCLRSVAAETPPAARFAASPMQFVQYAAMEVRDLSSSARAALIEELARVADPALADNSWNRTGS